MGDVRYTNAMNGGGVRHSAPVITQRPARRRSHANSGLPADELKRVMESLGLAAPAPATHFEEQGGVRHARDVKPSVRPLDGEDRDSFLARCVDAHVAAGETEAAATTTCSLLWEQHQQAKATPATTDGVIGFEDPIVDMVLREHTPAILELFERLEETENKLKAATEALELAQARLDDVELAADTTDIELASAGLPRVAGAFDPKKSYRALDIVAHNGSAFIATRDKPGGCPGKHWLAMAQRGERGPAGERGPRGRTGDAALSPPVIKAWRLDREHYLAIPEMSDGCEGPPLELRPLFEQFFNETSGA
jgi:hypothetical protein